MDTKLSPIVLFVYNRPEHTRRTVEALAKNELAPESELTVYSDGAKGESDAESVRAVREYARKINGFKSVTLKEQKRNLGLADSIIQGVTETVNTYGKAIVLEDDIVTSPFFLRFMNDALELYQNDERVMHVAGYVPPHRGILPDTFFVHLAPSWGWATWKRSWRHLKTDARSLMESIERRGLIEKFDLGGSSAYFNTLRANADGTAKTWAVKWYASVFLRDGLALFPSTSLVLNIGNDASGTNSDATTRFDVRVSDHRINVKRIPMEESEAGRAAMARFNKTVRDAFLRRVWFRTRYFFIRTAEYYREAPTFRAFLRSLISRPYWLKGTRERLRQWRDRAKAFWFYHRLSFKRTLVIDDSLHRNLATRGFFSIFRELIDTISANGNKKIRVEYHRTLYNNSPSDNMWDYYFEPIDNSARHSYRWHPKEFPFRDWWSAENPIHCALFHRIINERIRFKRDIVEDAERYVRENFEGKKILGVHFRGTDMERIKKTTDPRFRDATLPDYFEFIDSALGSYDKIFLATDDQKAYEAFRTRYGPKLLSLPTIKSEKKGVHFEAHIDKKRAGREVIMDVLLLSHCDFLIYGCSNVPTVVKYLNPVIQARNMDIKNDYVQ